MASNERLRIAVSGMVAGEPGQGGAAWAVLQYLLGLQRLGHDVVLVEPVDVADGAELADSPGAAYLGQVAAEHGLEHAALVSRDGRRTYGMSRAKLVEMMRTSDVLLNVSGMLTAPDLFDVVPVRVYIDLDPFFNQLWQVEGIDMRFEGHTHFVSCGTAIGTDRCEVPTLGRDWTVVLPPVVLDRWPVAEERPTLPFTTVGHWRSYGPIEYRGRRYGVRAHSVRDLLSLPQRSSAEFAPALDIHESETADIAALVQHGWTLLNPAAVASTPNDYRRFVRSSKAEIGLAKEGYALSRSGWFSDRTACYLASGRPALVQDTGLCGLPVGEGLVVFAGVEEAAARADEIVARYPAHAAAARAIAEELLDSDRVLTGLLETVGATG